MKKILLGLLCSVSLLLNATQDHYAINGGVKDQPRLTVVNDIYNGASLKHLSAFVKKGDVVLDVGCGLGLVSKGLLEMVGPCGEVIGIDKEQGQIDLAKQLHPDMPSNLTFQKESIFDVKNLNKKFDVIYVRFLFVHLPNPESALEVLKEILKPGGKIIIHDLTGNDSLYSEPLTDAMKEVQRFDTLQFEVQQSDDHYFEKFPILLIEKGFKIANLLLAHPQLDSRHKKSMLTGNLLGLKDALLKAGKITHEEFNKSYKAVEMFEQQDDVVVYSYEMGMLVAELRK